MIETTEAYGLQFAFPAGDNTVGRYLRDYGEFSRVTSVFAGQCVAGGSFLDVGANIGSIALPVAKHARHVVAIEAHRGLAALLRENVARNGLGNVDVLHAAAGSASGRADFPTAPLDRQMNYGAVGFGADFPVESVEVVTLDAVAPPDTAVVKIDVEGHELQVLAGSTRLLNNVRPIWIVESPDTPDGRAVISTFIQSRYELYWFFTPFFTPQSPRNGGEERIRGDINIIAMPAERPQPRGMLPVDPAGPRPSSVRDFPYLARFGFPIAPSPGQ